MHINCETKLNRDVRGDGLVGLEEKIFKIPELGQVQTQNLLEKKSFHSLLDLSWGFTYLQLCAYMKLLQEQTRSSSAVM